MIPVSWVVSWVVSALIRLMVITKAPARSSKTAGGLRFSIHDSQILENPVPILYYF